MYNMSLNLVALILASLLPLSNVAFAAKQITTNEIEITNAPDWLKQTRVEKITNRIQSKLEWTIRKIKCQWHTSSEEFQKSHSLGPYAVAVTKMVGDTQIIHIGPLVGSHNFDEIFGHELVHVIVAQKYKTAIPRWLEEGLANHVSNFNKVDYRWLAKQPYPNDVRELAHPTQGSATTVTYRYKASQAFAEMLNKKCDLENLLRLSVERKMEDYMKTYCEIEDLNQAFRDWVKKKSTAN